MIRNIIFDLDGTLLDTSEGIVEGIEFSINQMGFNQLSHEDLLSFVGPPPQKTFMEKCGCDEVTAQKATDVFRKHYSEHTILKAVPYDGILETCEQLKESGYKLAVATNKREDLAKKLLSHFGFDQYIDIIHGSDSLGKLKKSDVIIICLNEMQADPSETLVVGDTKGDAVGAQQTGCHFVGVTWGFGFKFESECLCIIKSPDSLLSILKK